MWNGRRWMTVALLAGAVPLWAAAQLSADYRSLDTDHDQRLSNSELPPASLLKVEFARFDKNHDKLLDSKELVAAEEAVRWRTEPHTYPYQGSHLEHVSPPPSSPVGYLNNNRGSNASGQ